MIPVPANDRYALVLLERVSERKTAGGLFIPETASADPEAVLRYKVVAAGPGLWSSDGMRRCVPMYAVGDTVLCNKPPAFREYQWEGETVVVVNEGDILGGYRE